jgi:hypothetical protein
MLQPRTHVPLDEFLPKLPRVCQWPPDEPDTSYYGRIDRPEGMTGEHWEAYKIAKLSEMRQQRNARGERCGLRRGRETREGVEVLRVC